MARKKMRLLVRVVYASDQDVFEREPLLFVLCIIVASRKQRLDVVFAVDRDDLIDNFVREQVARKSFQAARAKFASVSATDLRRNANCPPVRLFSIKRWRRWNQDGLDQVSVS